MGPEWPAPSPTASRLWDSCSAWDVVEQAGTGTRVKLNGAAHELAPLALSGEPELSLLVEAIDLRELSDAAASRA